LQGGNFRIAYIYTAIVGFSMTERPPGREERNGNVRDKPPVADLVEVYDLLKDDATNLLSELLRGISMWRTTGLIASFLTLSWVVLAVVITAFGHPYGSPYIVLYSLYLSIALAQASGITSVYLFSRYISLRRKYSRLFKIAEKLR
jgi:hypothetical protein